MKKLAAILILVFLTACQSTPKLEDDMRYTKLATVVNIYEFSETERQQAKSSATGIGVGVGFGIGVGTGGSFGGMMMGVGNRHEVRDEPPLVAQGANRYTVQPQGTGERIEVMSYSKYKVGDCVKVLAGHPSEYPRFFDLKAGEHCN